MTQDAFDLDVENAMLCAMMREPDCIEQAISIAGPSDFSQANNPICLRILELFQAGEIPDLVNVTRSLKERGELEGVGGAVYLANLLDFGAIGKNARSYAEQVKRAADKRRARQAIKSAVAKSADDGVDPDAAIEKLIFDLQAIPRMSQEKASHRFERLSEDRYALTLRQFGIVFEVDRLRREHNELIGELSVHGKLPGMRTYDGAVSIADFNLSSARSRSERAKLLADRSNVKDLDWFGFLEEMCQRVLAADRAGQPSVDLRELERPGTDDALEIEGLILPRRHPAIVFGDGAAAKSYAGLYLAGRMVEQGLVVAFFDWELAGEDHRDRLERLFGKGMPRICYARCERPLVYEVDRLRRIVRDERIEYAIFDSVAFACDGPPEAAEVASRYFRAVRQIGVGSLHIAHITKSEGSEEKPFGSVFWHNGARATYFAKLVDVSPDGQTLSLGLFNKKANLGRLHSPAGFKITFTEDRTYFQKSNPADTPDLAEKMSIRQRMMHLLCGGAMLIDAVAETLEAKPDTVRRTLQRYNQIFQVIEGGKVGLLQRDASPDTYVRTS